MISNVSKLMPIPPPARESKSSPVVQSVPEAVNAPVQSSAAPAGAVVNNAPQGGGADKALVAAVSHLNTNIQSLNRNLEFSIDDGSGEVVVKVVDSETQEVIRQIPREEVLALAQGIKEYAQDHHMGLLQAEA